MKQKQKQSMVVGSFNTKNAVLHVIYWDIVDSHITAYKPFMIQSIWAPSNNCSDLGLICNIQWLSANIHPQTHNVAIASL